ncbi:MAG TPA: pantoate--beta-alanine ligase [Firmicutes bacterium]|nr:pantoate--beta-alanine ligase [Bacillota bacterium]
METIRDPGKLREIIRAVKLGGVSVGFVPTMGSLHRGHLSLLEEARRHSDYVVLSIFVNPLQFGQGEDFDAYPRDLQGDLEKAGEAGCDLAFLPEAGKLYPEGFSTYVEVTGPVTETLCGLSRHGHFQGVTTVVCKLFHLVQPDRAYFGQKDAQQAVIIKKMVKDLSLDLQIVVCPTVREEDGVAMSSRNKYLQPHEREAARVLYRSLREGEAMILQGERSGPKVAEKIRQAIARQNLVKIDYVAVVDSDSLQDLEVITGSALLAVAVFIGKARLIDNLLVTCK